MRYNHRHIISYYITCLWIQQCVLEWVQWDRCLIFLTFISLVSLLYTNMHSSFQPLFPKLSDGNVLKVCELENRVLLNLHNLVKDSVFMHTYIAMNIGPCLSFQLISKIESKTEIFHSYQYYFLMYAVRIQVNYIFLL